MMSPQPDSQAPPGNPLSPQPRSQAPPGNAFSQGSALHVREQARLTVPPLFRKAEPCKKAFPGGAWERGRKGWIYVAWLLLAGYLLVCHGCHGDEDNELILRGHWQATSQNTGHPYLQP